MDKDKRPVWAELTLILVSAAATGLMIWYSMPPVQRQMATLEARQRTFRFLSGRASRAGRAGMGEELAGRDPKPAYSLAYTLSRWRDKVGAIHG